MHVADTSDSQTHAVSQGNGTSSSHVGDTSNSEQNGPAQGRGTSGLSTSDTSSSHRNPASNPQTTVTLTPVSSQNTIPQQFLNQLSNILQQATSTPTQIEDTDTMEDDRLSAASHPVQSSPPVVQPPMVRTSQVNPVSSQSTPLLVQPTLPPIPAKIKEKIARGEYIDFTTLLSKSMFGASEPQSQTLTLQLNPLGDNYSITPQASTSKRITSFSGWMEAWTLYLSVRVFLDPSCAPQLIAYQRIITTANSDHPLQSWINYDKKFITQAANNPSLRWDIRDMDLWLECFRVSIKLSHWPCNHCGSASHYPRNCPFRPSTSRTDGGPRANGGLHPIGGPITNGRPLPNPPQQSNLQLCHDFNRATCLWRTCKYLHICNQCGGPHPGRSCPIRGSPNLTKPLPWTPLQPFILERELRNYPTESLSDN